VDVLVTHLSLSRRARHRTISELAAFAARERRRSGSLGAVLMGDLNAQPDEATTAALERCGTAYGGPWLDAWKARHGGSARGGTWPAIAPFRRIDYVFVQPPASWEVRGCEIEPVSGSDHRGLLARLRLRATARALEPVEPEPAVDTAAVR
jgi:endonuclease/exonuclease/phosphatase family metal-dependent hydrolase